MFQNDKKLMGAPIYISDILFPNVFICFLQVYKQPSYVKYPTFSLLLSMLLFYVSDNRCGCFICFLGLWKYPQRPHIKNMLRHDIPKILSFDYIFAFYTLYNSLLLVLFPTKLISWTLFCNKVP
jgi:hypothetical protein